MAIKSEHLETATAHKGGPLWTLLRRGRDGINDVLGAGFSGFVLDVCN
jgi:hypothetical protein